MSDEEILLTPQKTYAEAVVAIERRYAAKVHMARMKANEEIAEALEACRLAMSLEEQP